MALATSFHHSVSAMVKVVGLTTHVTSALCSRVEIKGTKLVMPLENRQ